MNASDRYADVLSANLRHEEELINHRLSWLIQSQSAFFLALGIVGGRSPHRIAHLVSALIFVAPATCVVLYLAILAAIRVFYRHLGPYEAACRTATEVPPIRRSDVAIGFLAPIAIPPLFIAAWIVVGLDVG